MLKKLDLSLGIQYCENEFNILNPIRIALGSEFEERSVLGYVSLPKIITQYPKIIGTGTIDLDDFNSGIADDFDGLYEINKNLYTYIYRVSDRYKVLFFSKNLDYKSDPKWGEILKGLTRYSVETKTSKISLINNDYGHLATIDFDLKPLDLELETHYNDGFVEFNDKLINSINNDENGLYILHGPPGTGKTNYIRWLISTKLNRKVIFIPPAMSGELAMPNFISFCIENKGSVFVIEEAENVLQKRIAGDNQAVANILNMTDGILADCLNIKVIATFNTSIKNIDEALLRNGRLRALWKFDALTADKTYALSKKLGKELYGSLTLSEIYNENEGNLITNTKIGF